MDQPDYIKLCECGCGKPAPIAKQTSSRQGHKKGKPTRFVKGHAAKFTSFKHGHYKNRTPSPTYTSWAQMKVRCTNPNKQSWHRYGGRGIAFCKRWATFKNFLSDMGERPSLQYTIDRIDNDGNYEPGNCRWATVTEQQHNKKGIRLTESDVYKIRYELTSLNCTEISNMFSVHMATIWDIKNDVTWKHI